MEEEWRNVIGYEGLYEISNLGNIRSIDRNITNKNGVIQFFKGRDLKPTHQKDGYIKIKLWKDNKARTNALHRCVALAFINNPNNYEDVNHIDGNKANNTLDNLEWVTRSQNIKHAYNTKLRINKVGRESEQAKYSDTLVTSLIEEYLELKRTNNKKYLPKGALVALCLKHGVGKGTFWHLLTNYLKYSKRV